MEKQLTDWEVLKTFNVTYDNSQLTVKLVQHQARSRKEWFFEVRQQDDTHFILSKRLFMDKMIWIGGGISQKEAQVVGLEIERQLRSPIPMVEHANPFKYNGDIEIRIERFMLGDIPAEKAKNAYCADMWYQVHFPSMTVEVVYSQNIHDDGFSWLLESPSNLNREHFQLITELIDLYEKRKFDVH